MIKVQNPIFDTTKQEDKSFTLTDFPRGWLKIVPTQDGRCYLAMDIMLGYEDDVLCSKTLKILVDDFGLAYMNAPQIDELDFPQEDCISPIPNNVYDIGGKLYSTSNIFGFDLEHRVYSKYAPEESVFKFYALGPNLYGEILGRDSDSYLNARAVGYIAKYVNSHQKEINDRLDEIAKMALYAPTEEFLKLEDSYTNAFKQYLEGTGSYKDVNYFGNKYKKLKDLRSHSKPIKFHFSKVIENDKFNRKPKLFGEDE